MALPESGLFAVCESRLYPVTGTGDGWVMLHVRGDSATPPHLDAGTRRDGDRWATVSRKALQRFFRVHVVVAWRGEEFGLGRVTGNTAEIHGGSPPIAERLGLEGDQYNGFLAVVPVDELTLVDVQEREIDV